MSATPACPTCGEAADALSRYVAGGPPYLQPCGHFVVVTGAKPLTFEAHPEYGADVREQDVDWRCWEMWALTASRGGRSRIGVDPPLAWVLGHMKPA